MILEIALGIVVAVLILYFLPLLFGLGIALIACAVVLVAGGAVLYWAGSSSVGIATAVVVAIGVAVAMHIIRGAPIRSLRERIRRRKASGYDTTDLEMELRNALVERDSTLKMRRELGYTDDK